MTAIYQQSWEIPRAVFVYMGKATVIETVERNGRQIAVYDNGMERDIEANKIIRPPTAALITKETSQLMRDKRQEKTARLLRKRITEATSKVSVLPVSDSAAAVAEAGGILWEEIVLAGPDAVGVYPRDKVDAFFKLGQLAGVIPNAQQRVSEEKNDSGARDQAFVQLVGLLRDAIQPRDVVDGKFTDIRNDNE